MTFTSAQVFNGQKKGPYSEADTVDPLNVYGSSQVAAENKVLAINPDALVIRSSALFGPWDTNNFAVQVLNCLSAQETFYAADDVLISPTYIPHLVFVSLDLLIDKERGIWHITNEDALSWKAFAKKIALKGGYDPELVRGVSISSSQQGPRTPKNAVLTSQKGSFLKTIDVALNCFFDECTVLPASVLKLQRAETLL